MTTLRHALRSIGRTPGLATVVVVSLGAGIGVNTVVFSWIQARVLEPIPGVVRGSALYLVEPRTGHGLYPGASWPEYRDLRRSLRSVDALIAFRMAPLYVGEPGHVERAYGQLVSDNYFEALGLQPRIGRLPRADEWSAGGTPIAVISYDFWQTRFAADPNVTTRSLRVNGRPLPIAGVTPAAFQGTVSGVTFDLWLPATLSPAGWRDLEARDRRGFSMMARLAPGAAAAARAELHAAMQRLANEFPPSNATVTADLLRTWQAPRGPQRMLTGAVALLQVLMLLVLLAVCGNAANLVLARASARQREMSIRLALGATPRRVFTLLLTESLLLALAGAALGAVIAVWGTEALRAGATIRGLPLKFQTSIDGTGIAFACALGVMCGLLVGALPALHLARADAHLVARSAAASAGRHRLRHALMGAQVGMALVVLVAAAMIFRAFAETRSTDPGFRREGVLLATYDFSGRAVTGAVTGRFAEQVLGALRALPAVESAAIASSVPLDIHGLPSRPFALEGRARPEAEPDEALTNTVTPEYFELMRIPIVAGTDFSNLDDWRAKPEVIVNEEFTRRYLDRSHPLGREVQVRGRSATIVGVTGNSLYNAFGEPPTPIIYLSYRDWPAPLGEIHVRARTGSESAVAPAVRRVVRALDPELPLFNVRTLSEHVEANLVFRRIPARIFAALAPLLLALTSVGIYAVVAYTVSLRTTEIGVRMALGATTTRVLAQIVGESLSVAAAGALAGGALAFIGARSVAATRSADPVVFGGVPLLVLAVAALACWLPARRAARIDPAVALRAD